MYKLKKNVLKILKLLHLLAACCWIGGAASLSVLNLSQRTSDTEGVLYGINTASHLIDMWIVVVFGALGCLITGFLYGLLTNWGFFKHTWLIWKWILTIAAILSGTFFLGVWESSMLEMSREMGQAALQDNAYLSVKTRHLMLSSVQIAALIFMVWLSVFKPWGKKADSKKTQN